MAQSSAPEDIGLKRLGAHVAQPKRTRDGVQDEVGIGNRGEIDEGDPIAKVVADFGRGSDR